MNTKLTAGAISQVADVCAAAAGDMHTLHLNVRGVDFDTMHKKVLKKYYEELDEDYDSLAEWALCYAGYSAPNKNESAARINWKSFDGDVDRASAVKITDEILNAVLKQLCMLYDTFNKLQSESLQIGITNWLQTRIEYWTKELNFFNMRRV